MISDADLIAGLVETMADRTVADFLGNATSNGEPPEETTLTLESLLETVRTLEPVSTVWAMVSPMMLAGTAFKLDISLIDIDLGMGLRSLPPFVDSRDTLMAMARDSFDFLAAQDGFRCQRLLVPAAGGFWWNPMTGAVMVESL